MTTLFFMWGFVTVLNDVLVPHLKSIFDLTYARVMLIQFSFFSAYFIFSIPSAKLIDWIGYHKTMVLGLFTMGLGAFLFIPAASAASYPLFLTALMILAAGITALQVGALRPAQLARAADTFAHAPAGDARIVVMHHNPMRGELSDRHGLLRSDRVLDAFAGMRVQLVLCGHDHQEAVHLVERDRTGIVISTAGTLSSRSRGGRPSSLNIVTLRPDAIEVDTRVWTSVGRRFESGPRQCFAR